MMAFLALSTPFHQACMVQVFTRTRTVSDAAGVENKCWNWLGGFSSSCVLLFILAGKPQVSTPTGAMGYTTASGAFCGHTMLQHHPSQEGLPVFAHRNLLKWSANLDLHTPSWTAVKRGSLDLVDLAMGWLLFILGSSLGPE